MEHSRIGGTTFETSAAGGRSKIILNVGNMYLRIQKANLERTSLPFVKIMGEKRYFNCSSDAAFNVFAKTGGSGFGVGINGADRLHGLHDRT
jgi:hypothetical protein